MAYAVLSLCGLAIASHLINGGLALLLITLLLGPMWIWLMGRKQKYFGDHTRLGEARFSSRITWQGLFTLYLGNWGC
jgi:hypothetical protein